MEAGGQEGGRTSVVCNLSQLVDWDIFGMDPEFGSARNLMESSAEQHPCNPRGSFDVY